MRAENIFIVWHLSLTLPHSILTLKHVQTLANTASFYLDIVPYLHKLTLAVSLGHEKM